MLDLFYDKLQDSSGVAAIIISVAFMLFSGYAMTRITKKLHLPNVTAYIVAGILLGPYCFKIVPSALVEGMDFIADIALAFIAFGTGEFFRVSALKKNGLKVVVITVLESLMASALIFVVTFFLLRLDLTFSIVLAALAAATAPASTVMTIRQTGAKGDFVDTLLQVVALDDVVGLIAYSNAISKYHTTHTGKFWGTFAGGTVRGTDEAFDAEEAFHGQSPDYFCSYPVCFLRDLCPAGCIASTGLHVHGHGLY